MNLNKYLNRLANTSTNIWLTAGILVLFGIAAAGTGCGNATGTDPLAQEPGSGNDNAAARPAGYNGNLHGIVISKGSAEFEKTDDLAESIKNARLGQLSLEFSATKDTEAKTIELPKEAMDALNEYFRAKLEHRLVEGEPSENVKRDSMLLVQSNTARNRLGKVGIDAPDGKRKISQIEASRLILFVSNIGADLGSPARKGS